MSLIIKKISYDWKSIVEEVEKLSGRKIRDWSGVVKKQSSYNYESGNFPDAIWAKSKGYDWTVLNDITLPDGKVIPRTGEDLKLRSKINLEFRETEEYEKAYRSQDFWHYAIDNIFWDVSNGSTHYFNPSHHFNEIKDKDLGSYNYVKEILPFFIEVLKNNGLDDEIEVYIWW
jgi:hypothetical protein